MTERRRRDGRERREQILDAALEHFAEQGVVAARIEDIRRAARASPSSMYNLFDGLQDITLALLERIFADLFAHLTKRVIAQRTAHDCIVTMVDAHLRWVFAHRREAAVMYQAMAVDLGAGASERLSAFKAEALAPLAEHVRVFIERRELPAWTVDELDVVIMGPSHEACRRFLAGGKLRQVWMRETLPEAAWRAVALAR